MEHYFSYMKKPGRDSKQSVRLSIEEAFNVLWTPQNTTASEKGNGSLMAMGYDNTREFLDDRKEHLFTHMSLMMIDCDNGEKDKPSTWDKDIITKFNTYLGNYEFWTYESASSTQDRPKFRGIVPLDREVEWTKFNKKAIGHLFSMFVDEGASWFEEPLLPKLNTIKHHEGKLFPASVLEKNINMLMEDDERKMDEIRRRQIAYNQYRLTHPDYQPRKLDPHNLPCVKKYLEGSWCEGTDRRPRAHAAIYGMVSKDIPSEEIYDIIMSGPASEFKEFLHNSFIDSCASLHKHQPNPF